MWDVQVETRDHDHERERPDRHVDVEDPAPREVVDEEAAEQRARDGGDGEDGAHQAHVAAAPPRRDDVREDRLRADDQPARAEPLERAEEDQLDHRLREAGEHRPGEEDHDRRDEHGLAPEHVAELAVERRRDGRGQQVRRHDPGEVVEAAELADDRRQGGRDDRLVERGEEHAEHQRDEDRRERATLKPLVGDLDRRRARGARAVDLAHRRSLSRSLFICGRVSGPRGRGVAPSARSPSSRSPR